VNTTSTFALVAMGGALGAALRHLVSLWSLRQFGPSFPVGTMAVNILGSFLMGVLIAWFTLRGGSQGLRLFLAVGVLGGFTTFSAFSLDAVNLLEVRNYGAFAGYAGGTVVLSLGALMGGLLIVRAAT